MSENQHGINIKELISQVVSFVSVGDTFMPRAEPGLETVLKNAIAAAYEQGKARSLTASEGALRFTIPPENRTPPSQRAHPPEPLTLLGTSNVPLPTRPEDAKLERFPNPRGGEPRYSVLFHCTEFTSRCPITAAPDFGSLEIEYSPHMWCIESKSLKLFLGSFRETGAFWEALTNRIAMRLDGFLRPYWITVTATMNVRGGIGMTCRVHLGDVPE